MQEHPECRPSESTAVLLPLEWQARGRSKETRVAVETWLEAVLANAWPVSLGFTLTVSRTGASAGVIVRGLDRAASMQAAGLVRATAHALNGWQGLGEPEPYDVDGDTESVATFDMLAVDGPGRMIFNSQSAPWVVAAEQDEPATMVVDLVANDSDELGQTVRCRVSLHGDGPAAQMIATLLAADPPGRVRLEATPRQVGTGAPPEIAVPLEMAAHLVSSPARMPGSWPTQPVRAAGELLQLIDGCAPPHAVLFGGSGLGKTTLLEHLVDDSLAGDNTVVVICPHGDLAARAATVARDRGVDFSAIDFGDERHQARWNLCIPPPNVTPTQWAAELVPLIRNAWASSPDDWFGPVWVKSTRIGLSVLTRDPRGPHPLTELATVMMPPLPASWEAVLGRIDDPTLTKELTSLHAAIEKDPHGHWGIWVTSKLEPFTADDRIRAVLSHRGSTVDLTGVTAGRSLVVAAPASALGDEGATLLVSSMLTQLWHLIRQPRDRSRLIDIFVDEAHRIPHHTMTELLTEGRKFGVRLRVATQSPHQLPGRMRDSVLTNSGAIGTFRTGPNEAAFLEPMFPTIVPSTLTRLDRHWLALTDGEREMVGPTAAPLVDCTDLSALATAHARTHGPGRRALLRRLHGLIDALIDGRDPAHDAWADPAWAPPAEDVAAWLEPFSDDPTSSDQDDRSDRWRDSQAS